MRLLMLLFVGEWASSKHKTGGLDWKIDTANQEITSSKFKPLGLKKKALFRPCDIPTQPISSSSS